MVSLASKPLDSCRQLDALREHPGVGRAVDADVLRARLDAEGVEQPVIVVRVPSRLCTATSIL